MWTEREGHGPLFVFWKIAWEHFGRSVWERHGLQSCRKVAPASCRLSWEPALSLPKGRLSAQRLSANCWAERTAESAQVGKDTEFTHATRHW